jgi:hypothetical protein
MGYCNAMILCSSVTLVDKINNAKPDALLFTDGQGIFNRQFSSLVLMTNYLIKIKLNPLKKTPDTIACHKSDIGLDKVLGTKEAYQHWSEQRFQAVELLENNSQLASDQAEVAFLIKIQLWQNYVLLCDLAWKLCELGDVSLAGGLIHGRNTTMIDLETMIKGGNMMLDLLAGQQCG